MISYFQGRMTRCPKFSSPDVKFWESYFKKSFFWKSWNYILRNSKKTQTHVMEKALFPITGPSNIQLLKFWLFNFSNFLTNFVKNFMKKTSRFQNIDFESTDKVLPLHQYLWSEISWQWNNSPLNFFLKFEERFTS